MGWRRRRFVRCLDWSASSIWDGGHAAAGVECFPHALAGAEVRVLIRQKTLKDAINEAMRVGSRT